MTNIFYLVENLKIFEFGLVNLIEKAEFYWNLSVSPTFLCNSQTLSRTFFEIGLLLRIDNFIVD